MSRERRQRPDMFDLLRYSSQVDHVLLTMGQGVCLARESATILRCLDEGREPWTCAQELAEARRPQ